MFSNFFGKSSPIAVFSAMPEKHERIKELVQMREDVQHKKSLALQEREKIRRQFATHKNNERYSRENFEERGGVAKLQQLEQAVAEQEAAVSTAEQELAALNFEIRELQKSIAATAEVSLKDLSSHKQAIGKAEDEVKRLQKLIESQQALTAVDDSFVMNARASRQAVLADMAEGKASDSDLKAADKALAEAETDHRRNKESAERARETISGLSPRLEAASSKLADLQAFTPFIIEHYLRSKAEDVFKEYAESAGAMMACFHEFMAIHEALSRYGIKSEGAPISNYKPTIKPVAVHGFQIGHAAELDALDINKAKAKAEKLCAEIAQQGFTA